MERDARLAGIDQDQEILHQTGHNGGTCCDDDDDDESVK